MTRLVWKPTQNEINNSQITRFINFLNAKSLTKLKNSDELYDWSIKYPEQFWSEFWDFAEIQAILKLIENAVLTKSNYCRIMYYENNINTRPKNSVGASA